jgi:serine protease AprX
MLRSALRPFLVAVLMLPVAAAGTAQAAPARQLVVVGAEPGQARAAERAVARLGGSVERRLPIVRGFTARVPAPALARLERARAVAFVARDAPMRLSTDAEIETGGEPAAPADVSALESEPAETVAPGEDTPATGGARAVEAPDEGAARALAAMDVVRGGAGLAPGLTGAGVDVALIDSGVVGFPALTSGRRLLRGPDFSTDAADADLRDLDAFGHGTHLAGLITGNDPVSGFEGVAPGARLVSLKVASADGLTSLVRILSAFEWVRRHQRDGDLHIRVLNLSLGVDQRRSYVRDPLAHAVERLWRQGITVVAAAGNEADGSGSLDLPAADPYVIAVGATDTQDTADPADDAVAGFSSRDAVRPPDVLAPGVKLVSLRVPGSRLDEEFPAARIGGAFFRGSGTSQATAIVSGLAARLLQARPDLEPDQVKALLRAGAADLGAPAAGQGQGRVDGAALSALVAPSADAVRQTWERALLDLDALEQDLEEEADGTAPDVAAGEGAMSGRRWSGRRWSGRRWSGAAWSDDAE